MEYHLAVVHRLFAWRGSEELTEKQERNGLKEYHRCHPGDYRPEHGPPKSPGQRQTNGQQQQVRYSEEPGLGRPGAAYYAHNAPQMGQGTQEHQDRHYLQVDGYPRMCNPISNPFDEIHC